ncbi:hypothetical protein H8959_017259 [Pygathrix nigripes]
MAAGAEWGCPGTKGSSRGRKDKGHLGDGGRRASAERLPGRWAGEGCGLGRAVGCADPRSGAHPAGQSNGAAPAPSAAAPPLSARPGLVHVSTRAGEDGIREPVCFPNPSPSVLPTLQAVCRAGKKV